MHIVIDIILKVLFSTFALFVVWYLSGGATYLAKRVEKTRGKEATEVGMAIVSIIEKSGKQHQVVLHGYAYYSLPLSSVLENHVVNVVTEWRREMGKNGTVKVYDDNEDETYVPLCNIDEIKIHYVLHEVEA